MPRVRLSDFDKRLWLNPPRDQMPEGSLRRARGVHPIKTRSIRSRFSDSELFARSAHSLYRGLNQRFQGVGTSFYRNDTEIVAGTLDGNRLAFVSMPPADGSRDYVFVAGGGILFKVDDFGNVTNWGIEAPPDGFTAAKGSQLSKDIDLFEDESTWVETNATLANEAGIKQQGTNSMAVTVAASTLGVIQKSITIDLEAFAGPVHSPSEDFIALWVRVDNPNNIDWIQLEFSIGNTSFATDTFVRRIEKSSATPASNQYVTQTLGIGSEPGVANAEAFEVLDADSGSGRTTDPRVVVNTLDTLGQVTVPTVLGTWVRLRIPKSSFQKAGSAGASGWPNIQAMRFLIQTNGGGGVIVYLDEMKLLGSVGLQGRYRYLQTFRNGVTGTRSNANPNYVEVDNVERQTVVLSSLALSADPQVTAREIWRTVGNGTRFFKVTQINDNTTTVFTDTVADYPGLDSSGGDYLNSEELPTDNEPPNDLYDDAWGPWQGRMWWCRSSDTTERGNVFYSPAGRAEAVQDFVQVSNEDNPTVKGIVWNGANFVFTEEKLFRIEGTTAPFTYREVFGVPGTTKPHTIFATPFGIFYESFDGVRLFNGVHSTLVGDEAISKIFRGEASENLTAFSGLVATFGLNEYFISDGVGQTLAYNPLDRSWRDLGVGCTALTYEYDMGQILASIGPTVVVLEAEETISPGVEFEIETPSLNFDSELMVLERVQVDAYTPNTGLTATLPLDNQTLALGTVAHASRSVTSFEVNRIGRVTSLRLAGGAGAIIEIFGVAFDVRPVRLQLLVNGNKRLEIPGRLVNAAEGFHFDGIHDVLALINAHTIPKIRRLYVDMNPKGAEITPSVTFYNTTQTFGGLAWWGRQIREWQIDNPDRVTRLDILGDFTGNIEVYQIALDVYISEGP